MCFNLTVLSQCNARDCGCMCVLCTYMLVCLYKVDLYAESADEINPSTKSDDVEHTETK